MIPLLVMGLEILCYSFYAKGMFVTWKLVGKPSETITEIIGLNFPKLYVTTTSGEMYSLQLKMNNDLVFFPDQWLKERNYKKELEGNYSSYTGFTPLPPLFNIKQTYQFQYPQIEGNNLTKFALSDDGNLWIWSYSAGGYLVLFLMILLGIEILAYFIALLIGVVVKKNKRSLQR